MTDHIADSSKKVPPCPKCGAAPDSDGYDFQVGPKCEHISASMILPAYEWTKRCNYVLAGALRDLGIETVDGLKELHSRSAPLTYEQVMALPDGAKFSVLQSVYAYENGTHQLYAYKDNRQYFIDGKLTPSLMDTSQWGGYFDDPEPGMLYWHSARLVSLPEPSSQAREYMHASTNIIREKIDTMLEPAKRARSVLKEALEIVNGERAEQYGPADELFARWSAAVHTVLGLEATPFQLAQMMVLLKMLRQSVTSKRDNLVDQAGYTELAGRFIDSQKD